MLLLESNYIIFSACDNSQNCHIGDLDTQDLSSVRVYPQATACLLRQTIQHMKSSFGEIMKEGKKKYFPHIINGGKLENYKNKCGNF